MDLAFFAYLGSPFSTTKFFVDLQPNIDLAFFAYLARPFSTTKFSIDSQPNIDLARDGQHQTFSKTDLLILRTLIIIIGN